MDKNNHSLWVLYEKNNYIINLNQILFINLRVKLTDGTIKDYCTNDKLIVADGYQVYIKDSYTHEFCLDYDTEQEMIDAYNIILTNLNTKSNVINI